VATVQDTRTGIEMVLTEFERKIGTGSVSNGRSTVPAVDGPEVLASWRAGSSARAGSSDGPFCTRGCTGQAR
jgi:hypothetical protein